MLKTPSNCNKTYSTSGDYNFIWIIYWLLAVQLWLIVKFKINIFQEVVIRNIIIQLNLDFQAISVV